MVNGINNSSGVLAALRHLQGASGDLETTQNRMATGLKIQGARDDPSAFQTSQSMQGEQGSLRVVIMSLGRAEAVSDTAIAAGEQVSSLLRSMKETAMQARSGDLSDSQRALLDQSFREQLTQIRDFLASSSFDGANILDGSRPQGLTFVADADGVQTLTLQGRNISPGGLVVTISEGFDLRSEGAAGAAAEAIDTSIDNLGRELNELSAENKRVRNQIGFVSKLADALAAGVGRMVDADLAVESALIQALQVKQQLSVEAVGIVNRTPQALLSLLRS
jgi:flagellin